MARSRDFHQKQLYYDDSSSSDGAEGEDTVGGSPEHGHQEYQSSSSRDSFTNKIDLYKSKGYHDSSEEDEEDDILEKNRLRKEALLKEMRGKKV